MTEKPFIEKLKPYVPYLFIGLVIVAMLFVTESSPIFATNQWDDTNVSFTMGRAWIQNDWPYKALFEQRGPVFYILYAIAALISRTSFVGLFIVELTAAIASYIFLVKLATAAKFGEYTRFLVAFFALSLIYGSNVFGYGGSPEELTAPLIIAFIYFSFCYLQQETLPPRRVMVINGVLFGLVFWMKFTLIGIFIGYYFFYGLYLLVKAPAKFRRLAKFSLMGFAIPAIIVTLLFALGGAVGSLYHVYIFQNLTAYGNGLPFLSRVALVLKSMGNDLFTHPFILALLFSVLLLLAVQFQKREGIFLILLAMILCQFVTAYWSGNTQWYYLLAIVVIVAALVPNMMATMMKPFPTGLSRQYRFSASMVLAFFAIILFVAGNFNMKNAMLAGQTKYVLAQQEFGDYMQTHHKRHHVSLIEYNGIDSGFFLFAHVVPTVRYFEQTNFPYQSFPESYDAQLRYIRRRNVEFVAIRSNPDRDFRNQLLLQKPQNYIQIEWLDASNAKHNAYVPRILIKNYKMVKAVYSTANGESITYMLFQTRRTPLKSLSQIGNAADE